MTLNHESAGASVRDEWTLEAGKQAGSGHLERAEHGDALLPLRF